MKLTREFIQQNSTAAGGWTKAQLKVIGVDWPPQKGWIKSVEGREITGDQSDMFKALAKSKT